MKAIRSVVIGLALAANMAVAFAADARSALASIDSAGFVAPSRLELRYGLWTAEATTAAGSRVAVLFDPANNSILSIDRRNLGSEILDAAEIRQLLSSLGYQRVSDIELVDSFWTATATRGDGARVSLVLHPYTGAVLEERASARNSVGSAAGVPGGLAATDVQQALTRAGYYNIWNIKFDNGAWDANATNPQGQRVEVTVDALTGRVIRERLEDGSSETNYTGSTASGAGGLSATDVQQILTQAGYYNIQRIKFDHGAWDAKAFNPRGQWVEVTVDAVTGRVIREKFDD